MRFCCGSWVWRGSMVVLRSGDEVKRAMAGAGATGTAGATTNTGVLRFAQDDGVKRTTASATTTASASATASATATTGVLRFAQDDGVKRTTAIATATATANTGVLRFAQDDGVKRTTARATASTTALGYSLEVTLAWRRPVERWAVMGVPGGASAALRSRWLLGPPSPR